jgi:hypothetical protein
MPDLRVTHLPGGVGEQQSVGLDQPGPGHVGMPGG